MKEMLIEQGCWLALGFGVIGLFTFPFTPSMGGAMCAIGWGIHITCIGIMSMEDDDDQSDPRL